MPALDLENPEVAKEIDAIKAKAAEEAQAELQEKYTGLEKNHEQVIADRKAASQKAKEATEQLDRYKAATKERDIEDIESTFDHIEKANYQELLGKEKFDEAYEMRAAKERKEFSKQLEDATKNETSLKDQIAERDERLAKLTIDKVAVEKFLKSRGKETAVRDLTSRVREYVTLDKEGNEQILDQFGNPRKDSKGEPMTIDTLIDEVFKIEAPHLFAEVKGTGAPGSGGGNAGAGKKRSEMSSQEADKFIEEHGMDAYRKIPNV